MREFARRGFAFIFAFLLVATATTGGVVPGASPVGDASAEWVDCDLTDSLIGAAYNTLIGADTDCRWQAGSQTDYENITATDAYATALGMKDGYESYTVTTGNHIENMRTVAYSKAKITMVQELNNGSTASQAKAAVNDSIEDYYSRAQSEVIKDWNAKAQQVKYLNGTGLTIEFYRYENTAWVPTSLQGSIGVQNHSYSLANGSAQDVVVLTNGGTIHMAVYGTSQDDRGGTVRAIDPSDSSSETVLSTYHYGYTGTFYDNADQPTNGTENGQEARLLLNKMETQSPQVKDNMAPYVDEVYAQYAAGELNSADLATIDPSVIGQEAATEFGSTGYYSQAAIMLASLGSSGNINASHTIETGDGTTLNGTLYYTADDVPANGWATGTTYNVSDYNGTFYMAVQKDDGNGTIVDLANYGETWTITEALNTQTGESLNTTTVQSYTYDSTNASALADELDRLRDLRAEYEQSLNGGGSSGGGLNTQLIGGALLVGAAAVLLIQREGNK